MVDQHEDYAATVYLSQIPRELDMAEADGFEEYLRLAIARHGRRNTRGPLIVDLADLEFISSAGVQALLRGQDEARRSGLALHVCNPAPIVARVFGILGVRERLVGRTAPAADASAR